MKMLRKVLLVTVLLLCVGVVGFVAYGYIFASSNVVRVDVQYAVELSILSVEDSQITLNAAVTNNGDAVRAGITVDFYCSVDGGYWTFFATSFTDAGGNAQAIYTVFYNGAYDFQAIVTIP